MNQPHPHRWDELDASRRRFLSRSLLGAGALLVGGAGLSSLHADPPVRVAGVQPGERALRHPLDTALDIAQDALVRVRRDIKDYTCTMVKRERIEGKLSDEQYIFCKFRTRREEGGQVVQPFSVYMYFLKPTDTKGREVVFIEGQNSGKLCAHEGGRRGHLLPTVWLKPDGALAMRGQLYPITDSGLEQMVLKLIERGTREKQFPDVQVSMDRKARLQGRLCTVLEVKHPLQRPEYEFCEAQIFIDDELQLPVRYAAYGWPTKEDSRPVLEEYTYVDLKLNVGLTDDDFNVKNPNYRF